MISKFIPLIGDVLDRVLPDKEEARKAKLKLLELSQAGDIDRMAAQKEVIMSEAKGESWLQQSWRPLTMLVFVGLIVAHWMGFTAPNITEAVLLQLLEIVKIGLGGYVVGRSGEKIMREFKKN